MSANGTASQLASLCSCHGCGATAPITKARITGTWSVSVSGTDWACPTCTRSELSDIETGLDRVRH
jgi:hypothetical protein